VTGSDLPPSLNRQVRCRNTRCVTSCTYLFRRLLSSWHRFMTLVGRTSRGAERFERAPRPHNTGNVHVHRCLRHLKFCMTTALMLVSGLWSAIISPASNEVCSRGTSHSTSSVGRILCPSSLNCSLHKLLKKSFVRSLTSSHRCAELYPTIAPPQARQRTFRFPKPTSTLNSRSTDGTWNCLNSGQLAASSLLHHFSVTEAM
jgi:hypothetical protein